MISWPDRWYHPVEALLSTERVAERGSWWSTTTKGAEKNNARILDVVADEDACE